MHPIDRLPEPISEHWDWQVFAACRGMDVDRFFHPYDERREQKRARIVRAKAVCAGCPVLSECRDHALSTREPYGIWGGLSEGERAAILGVRTLRHPGPRRRNAAARPPEPALGTDMAVASGRFGLGGTA